jgi:natural product biosynthesis luciferase-like monooxygenase protein
MQSLGMACSDRSEIGFESSTIVDLLCWRAIHQTSRQAYTFVDDEGIGDAALSYGELDGKARAIGALLESTQASNQTVLLLYPPGLDYISAFFGCLYAGAVAVPAYPPRLNRSLDRLQAVVSDARPTVALTTGKLLARVQPLLSRVPEFELIRWVASDDIDSDLKGQWREPELRSDDIAFLQYTSGSTSRPKGVKVSHGNLLHNEGMIQAAFNQTEESIIVSWLPLYHDMGLIGSVLQPLYLGAKCILMSPLSFLQRPFRWLEAMSRYRATTSGGPNFAYDLCVRKITDEQRRGLDLSSWRVAFNGAEPIRAETIDRFCAAFEPCGFRRRAFHPCYGLAEATLIVSGKSGNSAPTVATFQGKGLELGQVIEARAADEAARPLVSSGAVAADQTVAIVNPETLTQCQPNQVGEIWVSGPSVTRGYWNRPEETSYTYDAQLSDTAGPHYLRTGDLGFMQNGELFVTGRLKDLIIIRGLNYYPQDIELTVESSSAVCRPGCGAAFSIEAGTQERLVIVQEVSAGRGFEPQAVIDSIARAIADRHDLQAYAIVLTKPGAIPKTSSGKIQRNLCRARFLSGDLNGVAEWREESEQTDSIAQDCPTRFESVEAIRDWLISRVAAMLTVEPSKIDVNKSIAYYGLDSLNATELMHSLEGVTGVVVPVAGLFPGTSITELAWLAFEQLAGSSGPWVVAASPEDVEDEYPLSVGQKALWYLQQLSPESPAYNIASAVRIETALDADILRRAFQALAFRHPCLRARIAPGADGPVQRIEKEPRIFFHQEDASSWSDELLNERLVEGARLPFNLEEDSLLRVYLFTRASDEHAVLLVVHHIAADLWSLATLLHELGALYESEKNGSAATLRPLTFHYADYVRWQAELLESAEGERMFEYWRHQLDGAATVLNLATDRPRPPIQTFEGASESFKLDQELTDSIKAFAQAHQITLYTVLLAAFQALLYRYTGLEDILVGSPTAGRNQRSLAEIVGYFVNPVVMRADFSEDPTAEMLLDQMRRNVSAALQHQDYPFAHLVERLQPVRDPSRSPLFQVMFTLQKANLPDSGAMADLALGEAGTRLKLGELELQSFALDQRVAQFDLTLIVAESGGPLSGSLQYNADLFVPSTIKRMLGHYQTVLQGIIANPHSRISELPLLTEREKRHLLIECNDTGMEYEEDKCIHELFEAQVERTPDSIAVVFESEELTYRELNVRANLLAHHLKALGVGPDVRVGIYVERSVEMIAGMLGILKAGGAYVPLDPMFPKDRLEYMAGDADMLLPATTKRLARDLPNHRMQPVYLDATWRDNCPIREANPHGKTEADHLAYVIYTSGSTGKPKGVMVTHRNVSNFFTAMDAVLGPNPAGAWLALTSISFDISALELLWTLTRGFKVVIQGGPDETISLAGSNTGIENTDMELSLFYFASDDQVSGAGKYKLLMEGARFADENGFSAIWTPERHFHPFGGLYPNPSLTSAAIAAVTKNVQIRAGSVVLPLHNPVRVVEEWSVVDNLSNGRVGISFASGWHADDFVFAPDNYANRQDVMLREIENVRRLWRGEPICLRGGAGNQVEVRTHPRPVQTELPIWITSAGNAETFRMAGELGANLLTHLLGQDIEELAEKISIYRSARREQGRGVSGGHVTLMLHTFVGESIDVVREKVRQPFCDYLRSSYGLIKTLAKSLDLRIDSEDFTEDDMQALLSHAFDRYFETSGLFGTPEMCLQTIGRLKAIGVDEIACLIDFGVDFDSVIESLKYLAQVRNWCGKAKVEGGEDYSLAQQIKRHQVTHLQCTPSRATMLSREPETFEALKSLKKLLLGGEALPPSLAQQLRQEVPCDIHNMYGPTETTIWSTSALISNGGREISLGRPVANTEVYILDNHLQPVPVGIPGELYIGGEGVVRGYLGRSELTATRFIPNPFSTKQGARLYKTGDLAQFLSSGNIEFLGRTDHQVKIRGFRIEPAELEMLLAGHPAVRDAVVVAREDKNGDKRLVAYVVAQPDQVPTPNEMRAYIRKNVPEYMVPSTIVFMEALPLTPNGKIDRGSLPAPEQARPDLESQYVMPRGPVEELVAAIWAEVLGLEQVGVHDNFFDLGGHSLLASQLTTRLCETFQMKLRLRTLLEFPTVSGLTAALLRDSRDKDKIERIAQLYISVARCSEEDLESMLNEHVPSQRDMGIS